MQLIIINCQVLSLRCCQNYIRLHLSAKVIMSPDNFWWLHCTHQQYKVDDNECNRCAFSDRNCQLPDGLRDKAISVVEALVLGFKELSEKPINDYFLFEKAINDYFLFKFPSVQVNNGSSSVETRKLEIIKKGPTGRILKLRTLIYKSMLKNTPTQTNNALKTENQNNQYGSSNNQIKHSITPICQ